MAGTGRQAGGKFDVGHAESIGNRGPTRPDFCTQAIISQLHEIDRNTSSEKIHVLVEKLLKLAMGYTKKVKQIDAQGNIKVDAKGRPVLAMVEVEPDIAAIREVFDRVQGKAPQSIDLHANIGGGVMIVGGLPAAPQVTKDVTPRPEAPVIDHQATEPEKV